MMSLREALKSMEAGKPFSISFVKKSSGEIVSLEEVVLAKFMNQKEKEIRRASTSHTKEVDHYENSSRLLYIISSGQIRECKIWLITKFNGKPVFF